MAKKKQQLQSDPKPDIGPEMPETPEMPLVTIDAPKPTEPPKPPKNDWSEKLSYQLERALKSARQWVVALLRKQSDTEGEGGNAMTMPLPAESDRAFKLSGILVLVCILLVVAFSTILGAKLYSVMGMGIHRYKNVPVVYLDSNAALHYMSPLLAEPVAITDRLIFDTDHYSMVANTRLSANGKQLLYLDELSQGSGKLYLRKTSWLRPLDQERRNPGELVAEQVSPEAFRFVLLDKAVLYLETKQPGGNRQAPRSLYLWQGGKQRLLATQVQRLLGEAVDHKAYYTADTQEGLALYSINLSEKNSQPIPIDAGLDGIILEFAPENGGVLYSKPNDKNPDNPCDLYRWDGKTVLRIAEGVSALLDYGPKGEVFYLRLASQVSDPFQYFEDDMQAADTRMTEPREEDFMVESVNLWGTKKTKLDTKAYEKAQKDYADKLVRDEIRKAIATQGRVHRTLELMYSTGTSETLLDTGILQIWDTAADGAAAIYTKSRIPSAQAHKISTVASPEEAIQLINTVLVNTVEDYYYAKVGSEPVIFLSATGNEQVKVQLDGAGGFYYVKGDKKNDGGVLSYVTVQPEGLGVAKKLDDRVLRLTDIPYEGQLLYLRDEGEGTATLCATGGSSKSRLAEGLPQYPLPEVHGNRLLFYRDYDGGRQIGQLTLYAERAKAVGDCVWDYTYRLPDYIYLLQDYDAGLGAGNLYLYTGNSSKLSLVARGVTQVSD